MMDNTRSNTWFKRQFDRAGAGLTEQLPFIRTMLAAIIIGSALLLSLLEVGAALFNAGSGVASEATNTANFSAGTAPEQSVLKIVFLFMLMLSLVGYGPYFGQRVTRWGMAGFFAAFAWTLAGMVGAQLLVALWPSPGTSGVTGNVAQVWARQTVLDRFVRASYAAFIEEFLLVAVPIGAVIAGFSLTRQLRSEQASGEAGRISAFAPAVIAAAVGFAYIYPRSVLHSYQGANAVRSAALWTAINLTVYLVYRSVWPLILAHFFFDFFIAGEPWVSWTSPIILTMLLLMAASCLQLLSRSSNNKYGLVPTPALQLG
ncbi:hypothetical protein IV500_06200 [Paeniglutamicibacter antarcticus]|uniref:Uncharacterized protein n=1 Tax=Arthrobacter terrae TaxID=2935737 RepID=A0A931CSM6_9MICC|nr:hypothetical protein [Arthrobacter terrae]MBG0739013.1 hypothetical protein [Arthrobacter terrae]